MKEVFVIHEKDLDDHEQIVIGVADSVENAERIIREYYGDYKQLSYRDIRDSDIEYSKRLEVKDHLDKPHIVEVYLQWFTVNEI
jgi:hypothetical protein